MNVTARGSALSIQPLPLRHVLDRTLDQFELSSDLVRHVRKHLEDDSLTEEEARHITLDIAVMHQCLARLGQAVQTAIKRPAEEAAS